MILISKSDLIKRLKDELSLYPPAVRRAIEEAPVIAEMEEEHAEE